MEEEQYECYTTRGCSDKVKAEYDLYDMALNPNAYNKWEPPTSMETVVQSQAADTGGQVSSDHIPQAVESSSSHIPQAVESSSGHTEVQSSTEPAQESENQTLNTEPESKEDEYDEMEEDYEEEYFNEKPKLSYKNPLQLLNEMYPGLEYNLIRADEDEDQLKIYTMAVEVEEETYEGTAHSKKEAKKLAAAEALLLAFNIHCVDEASQPYKSYSYRGKQTKVGNLIDPDMGPHYSCKNAIMQLHELHKDTRYYLRAEGYGRKGDRYFTMATVVCGERYQATSKNKKLAKLEVATIALKCAYNVHIVPESEMPEVDERDPLYDSKNPGFNFGSKRRSKNRHKGFDSSSSNFDYKYERSENPVTQLFEIRPYLEFLCLGNSGNRARPWYVMSVEMDEAIYEGSGVSKYAAKQEAARNVLKALETYGKPFKRRRISSKKEKTSVKNTDVKEDHVKVEKPDMAGDAENTETAQQSLAETTEKETTETAQQSLAETTETAQFSLAETTETAQQSLAETTETVQQSLVETTETDNKPNENMEVLEAEEADT